MTMRPLVSDCPFHSKDKSSNSHTSFRRGLKKPNRRIDWY